MENAAVKTRSRELGICALNDGKAYHSVELVLKEFGVNYQFRIWCTDSFPMCFLAKEDSRILGLVKAGDTLKMKFYPSSSDRRAKYLNTQIKDITREDKGPFKGHCLVGLQIVEGQM